MGETYFIKCKKCGSEDCTSTTESSKLAGFDLTSVYRFCNTCGHIERELWHGGKTLLTVEENCDDNRSTLSVKEVNYS